MGPEELERIDSFLRKAMQKAEYEMSLCNEGERSYAFWAGRRSLIKDLLPLLGEIDGKIAAQAHEQNMDDDRSEKDCMWEAD